MWRRHNSKYKRLSWQQQERVEHASDPRVNQRFYEKWAPKQYPDVEAYKSQLHDERLEKLRDWKWFQIVSPIGQEQTKWQRGS